MTGGGLLATQPESFNKNPLHQGLLMGHTHSRWPVLLGIVPLI